MKHHTGWTLGLAVALCGCAIGGSGDGARPEVQTAAQWSCSTSGTRVSCTTAITNPRSEQMAYACKANEGGATCPDPVSVKNTPGLNSLLATTGTGPAFSAMPWACLVTGRNQADCLRDVAGSIHTSPPAGPPAGTGQSPPASGEGAQGTSSPPEGTQGTRSGPPVAQKPVPPTTCEPTAWEPYFAAVATYEYQTHGVSITFPIDLFDVNASFDQLAVASASDKSTPGAPSCASGEQGMREQSWLDATTQGCEDLNNPILVMCQQAANYAPDSSACNATGTW